MQVEALRQCGVNVILHAQRTVRDPRALGAALQKAYGLDLSGVRKVTGFSRSARAANLKIGLRALTHLLWAPLTTAILSRNLYAAFLLGVVMGRSLIFETHQLETGLRRLLQARLLANPRIITVVISKSLIKYLTEHHGFVPVRTLVLPDAAPAGIVPVPPEQRRARLTRLVPHASRNWRQVCGYFGHLYAGRGLEVIEAMADERPNVLFLVFGGNEKDLVTRCRSKSRANLHYMGHVSYPVAQEAMLSMDVLLMPYQKSVSIGITGHDTAQWMSPIKMFEYMASDVPIISSDLPVLREVLEGGRNALLVSSSDPQAWVEAVDRLAVDPGFAAYLGANAHADYRKFYTWTARALRLLEAAEELQFARSSS
ncbi:MAG: glycosyltransferase [Proteobacteria bacterium]|nr:glycosyltransferase [Pseudomonadota bacterium]NBS05992.1 glycosyltransferase [Verrucomicrobiota bacterium]NBS49119.1 glycosyltransferase [Verrucomicrobiota bacterium]NBS78431.1 glycosyltransferase [bacterium]